MNPKYYIIACLSFSLQHASIENSFAMGSKNMPVETANTQTKQQLIEELFKLFHLETYTLEKFLEPLEPELKALGLPEKPFAQSIQKINNLTNEAASPLIELLKDLYMRAHENSFTREELVDLVAIYKKPEVQKMNLSVPTMMTEPLLRILKDQKLFTEYSGKIMTVFLTMGVQQATQNLKELSDIATKEAEEFKASKIFYQPEFLEKLKQRYAGLAPYLEKWFGKEITDQKIADLIENFEKGLAPKPNLEMKQN